MLLNTLGAVLSYRCHFNKIHSRPRFLCRYENAYPAKSGPVRIQKNQIQCSSN